MIVPLVCIILLLLIIYLKYCYNYWQRLGVPSLPVCFPFGNFKDNIMQRTNIGDLHTHFYVELKKRSEKGYGGVYMMFRPIFVPTDPELIKHIMQRDFNHFTDRGVYMNEKKHPISAHLFNITGQRWRALRQKLTPTFTSGKMKYMFQTVLDCSEDLPAIIEQHRNEPIDIKDIASRYTTDVIGTCAFGIECNSLKNPNCDFRVFGKKAFARSPLESLLRFLAFSFPNLMLKLNVSDINPEMSDFFTELTENTVEYRRKNNVLRKDFINLVLELEDLSMDQIVAQAFVFFAAGFDTSATTLTFLLFELSRNVNVQDKLRREVVQVLIKHNGRITYDALMDMKYMECCIDETLRKYPPISVLNRICTEDYRIPDTDVVLKKGTHVQIPIKGIHYDPEYYPEPEKFIPERFQVEQKATRHSFTHLPFGEGPRICIGLRFGYMQMKVGLAMLIKRFNFTLSDKTQLPLHIHPRNTITSTVQDIWLNAERI